MTQQVTGMNLLGFSGVPSSGTADELERYLAAAALAPTSMGSSDGSWISCAAGPSIARGSQHLAVVRGNLRWVNDGASLSGTNEAETVLAAYERFGEAFLERLHGSFAVAVVDLAKRRVLLAVDRMGIERMTYSVADKIVAFGSSAQQVARSPLCRRGINRQSLYDFLLLHMIPAPNTIYTGVHKLRPGTLAVFEAGNLTVRRYWQPKFVEGATNESFDQWRDELHSSLMAAVQSCKPDDRTGAFLSGGLDSTTVVGALAKVSKTKVKTFSMGFGVDAYDELQYARISSRHFACDPLEYHVTPDDIVTAFPLIAKAYDEPFGNSSAVPTYICALRAHEKGMTHLLAGDGGDEIFGGNERYVRQRVFESYYGFPALLRHGLIEPMSRLLPKESGPKLLRKVRSYVDQARIPMPERLESWNFMYLAGKTMLHPKFQRDIDTRAPFETMRTVYNDAPADSLLHKMLYFDWHFTLSDNDLRKVGTMCELAGVQVSYPLLDQRIVDLSLRIPPNKKIEGSQLRSFYKQAMRGFLPDEVLTKSKHGFGLPFGEWLKTHAGLGDLIYSHLNDIKQRDIVNPQFIDDLIAQHKGGHASFYGYAIWDIAMLEAWLKVHG